MSKRKRFMARCASLAVVVAFCTSAWAQESPAAQTPPADATAPQPTPQPKDDVKPAPTTPDTRTDAEVEPPTEISADDVLREFQRDRPRAEPLLPQAPGGEAAVQSPSDEQGGGAGLRRLPDGSMLVDRSGRLVQDGSWWTIAFVGDNNPDRRPDPPMKLLPNQMLERAIRETQDGSRSVEFIVSGEVTDFMGENFLLLRKLMRKREIGNISN